MARRGAKADANAGGALQMSFFTPESTWRPTRVSELPSWKGAKRVAIDAETFDPTLRELGIGTRRRGKTIGWAFAIEGGPKHYLPIRHEGGDNLPEDEVLRYMREQIRDFEGEYVGANLSYDYEYGAQDGFEWNRNAKFRDVQIADPLIYELHFSYSLKAIGERNDVDSKKEEILQEAARSFGLDPKRGMWRLPARYVGEYAENDVDSPLKIYEKQRAAIDRDRLWNVFDLETDVLPVLVKMRMRGVRIDFDKLEQIERWAEEQEREALDLVYRQTNVRVALGDVWKPGAIAPALIETGMTLARTSTGAPQIDKAVLGGNDHPVPQAILRARKVNKLRTTFAASIRKYETNGRIHCTFNQIAREDEAGDQKGVRYGRLSAVDPNLQQQPSPDRDPEIAGEWRKIFLPEEGGLWGVNDYSQQEPRWTTHFAAVMDLPKAREAARRYQENPDTDNHDMMTRLIHGDETVDNWLATDPKGAYKVNRGYSKNIFLGVCYGEGGPKLCRDIKKPTRWALISGWGKQRQYEYFESRVDAWNAKADAQSGYIREVAGEEGQEILDNFDREVPYVRELSRTATDRAEQRGFVTTILGRRLHFEQRQDGTYDYTHKALNRIIQGSSADQTKRAIVEMDRAGYYLQLQVHDETDGTYGSEKEARAAGQIMRECVKSEWLPFKVDTEVGPSWGELRSV